ncbi:hypothetical protein H1C71_007679 [Ictidomys tridecemlineatus]|nr:hypothetical protein H1C71_007679 [Ictidomys tridecemlineatus]
MCPLQLTAGQPARASCPPRPPEPRASASTAGLGAVAMLVVAMLCPCEALLPSAASRSLPEGSLAPLGAIPLTAFHQPLVCPHGPESRPPGTQRPALPKCAAPETPSAPPAPSSRPLPRASGLSPGPPASPQGLRPLPRASGLSPGLCLLPPGPSLPTWTSEPSAVQPPPDPSALLAADCPQSEPLTTPHPRPLP